MQKENTAENKRPVPAASRKQDLPGRRHRPAPDAAPHAGIPQHGPEPDKTQILSMMDRMKDLRVRIEAQDLAASLKTLDGIFTYMTAQNFSLEVFRHFGMILNNCCAEILYKSGKSGGWDGIAKAGRIWQSESVSDIREILQDTVETVIEDGRDDPGNIESIVYRAGKYIEVHYAEDISLEKLAGRAHISTNYLGRSFKRIKGITIASYIQNIRVEKASEMLRTSGRKIYEIADAVGICDPVYFSQIFKRVTGMKPCDYRKMNDPEKESRSARKAGSS